MLDQQDTDTTEQIVVIDDPLLDIAEQAPAARPAAAVPPKTGRHREERLSTDPKAYRCTDVAGPSPRRRRRRGLVDVAVSASSWLSRPVTM